MNAKSFRVAKWEDYQHYKERRPPWVKFHVAVLDSYELTSLPYVTQLLADRLLLVASKTSNAIPNDSLWLAKQTHIEPELIAKGIEELAGIGFVEPIRRKRGASTPLAERLQDASETLASRAPAQSQETETETERTAEPPETPKPTAEPAPLVAANGDTIQTRAAHAYQSHGGDLELHDRRQALIGQVTRLAKKKTDERLLLAACADLGRRNEFPGYLPQEVEKLAANGGPCANRGSQRLMLTIEQLEQCDCDKCRQYAEHKRAEST